MPGIRVIRPRPAPRAVRDSLSSLALFTLIALELAAVITWSWWRMLSPIWLGTIFLLLVTGGVAAVLMVWTALNHWRMRRKARMFWRAVEALHAYPDFPGENLGFPGSRR